MAAPRKRTAKKYFVKVAMWGHQKCTHLHQCTQLQIHNFRANSTILQNVLVSPSVYYCLLFIHELIPSRHWVIVVIEVMWNRQLDEVKLIIQKERKEEKSARSLKARLQEFVLISKNAGNYFPWILQDQVCHWLKLCLLKWKSRTLMSLIVLQARYFQWDC